MTLDSVAMDESEVLDWVIEKILGLSIARPSQRLQARQQLGIPHAVAIIGADFGNTYWRLYDGLNDQWGSIAEKADRPAFALIDQNTQQEGPKKALQ